jgi:glutamate formiminotransferase / 5-formyltetrahydrofolate cyclo-ligase
VAQFSLVEMTPSILLAVPNFSEGRDPEAVAAIGRALLGGAGAREGAADTEPAGEVGSDGVRLLDVHSDPDHHRSVFTLAGQPGRLADALLRGAGAAVERIDVMSERLEGGDAPGQHPFVGALDVAPVVYLDERTRGAACAEALVLADRIGEELGVPVFLYGELTSSGEGSGRTRAELRRGGPARLAERMDPAERSAAARGEISLRPDFGPRRMHPTAGATLVAAREPLVAFNLLLAPPASVKEARQIAGLIREGGAEGLPGVRALGMVFEGTSAQLSMNIERPLDVPLAMVIEAVSRHASVDSAELVGLAPSAALEGFPADVPLPGFDPARHVIENALRL